MLNFIPVWGMIPISLRNFKEFLDQLTAADFGAQTVDKYLAEVSFEMRELARFTHFRNESYGRNLIAKNRFYELLILTWEPNQRTPIHDHAGSRCWMMIQSGSLCFKTYLPPVSLDSPLVSRGPVEIRKNGESVYIDDGIGVHSITNTSPERAVSIHLYAGPISQCQIYNEGRHRFEKVQLGYFTVYGEPCGERVG